MNKFDGNSYGKLKAILCAFLLFCFCLSGCGAENESISADSADTGAVENNMNTSEELQGIRMELTSLELQELMGNGINLGNTMEAWNRSGLGTSSPISSYETCWGQPVTTREMISGMKAAGFSTLRIPVAWVQTMDIENGDYTIRADLLDRVEEIVNYALDEGMYVIINDHWDGGWWAMFSADEEEALKLYTSMWTQVSERFRSYSDYLIFEGANEEVGNRLCDPYPDAQSLVPGARQLSTDECYRIAGRINQAFVDTVRSTGGNNEYRFLLIPGYDTNIACTCDPRFIMPEDTAENKLLISVHYYDPSGYCIFGSFSNWGSSDDLIYMRDTLAGMKKFTDAGYGVVIGEYGVVAADGGVLQ
nr:glycoside hydrolase family 5 protein [Lachnospiraceae bacterium]